MILLAIFYVFTAIINLAIIALFIAIDQETKRFNWRKGITEVRNESTYVNLLQALAFIFVPIFNTIFTLIAICHGVSFFGTVLYNHLNKPIFKQKINLQKD